MERLTGAGLMTKTDATILMDAAALYQTLTNILQLCSYGTLHENEAPAGLKTLLSESLGEASFDSLKTRLAKAETEVYAAFQKLLGKE
jgi:hypothetical protein